MMSLMSTSLDTIATVAQSFAAELSTNDGVTRLMIGGGYGFNILSKPAEPPNPVFSALVEQALDEVEPSQKILFNQTAIKRFLKSKYVLTKRTCVLRNVQRKGLGGNGNYLTRLRMCHPYNLSYIEARQQCLCCRIFVRRTSPSLQGEKSLTTTTMQLLAVRILLKDLTARKDLNGSIGRVGPWLAERGRYHMCLFRRERAVGHSRVLSSHVL